MDAMKETPAPLAGKVGLGEALRQARIACGMTQETLARDLRLPVPLLNAIETEDWSLIPPGRERPLTRIVAERMGVDLALHEESFQSLPGGIEQEPPDPGREAMERILLGVITAGSLALLVWLVMPGRDLRSRMPAVQVSRTINPPSAYVPPTFSGPYPVLGEVMPEAPVTEEGILVNLRAMDTCEAKILSASGEVKHSLRVSEPWRVRVKGPFTLTLDNAGVAEVEVARHRIWLDSNVGEAWSGAFGSDGALQLPRESVPEASPTAPETDPQAEAEPEVKAQAEAKAETEARAETEAKADATAE